MDIKYSHGGDIYSYINKNGKRPLDYSANTNPLGVPDSIKKAIIEAIEDFDVYPDPRSTLLRAHIGEYEKVNSEDIIVGNGAADLIFRLANILKPKSALVLAPTFSEYEDALKTVGTKINRYYLKAENNFDPKEDILEYISQAEIVFICSPNNPTGRIFPKELLLKIIKKCEEEGKFLVVDNCFLDFAQENEENNINIYTKDNKTLIVLKAFTKTYACAGLRLGYLISSNIDLKTKLYTMSQPWSVSSPAQLGGIAACQDKNYLNKSKIIIEKERIYLTQNLKNLKYKVFKGSANYILFYTKDFSLDKKLEEKGILIRNCSNYFGLEQGYFRICIKNKTDNIKLIEVLKQISNKD